MADARKNSPFVNWKRAYLIFSIWMALQIVWHEWRLGPDRFHLSLWAHAYCVLPVLAGNLLMLAVTLWMAEHGGYLPKKVEDVETREAVRRLGKAYALGFLFAIFFPLFGQGVIEFYALRPELKASTIVRNLLRFKCSAVASDNSTLSGRSLLVQPGSWEHVHFTRRPDGRCEVTLPFLLRIPNADYPWNHLDAGEIQFCDGDIQVILVNGQNVRTESRNLEPLLPFPSGELPRRFSLTFVSEPLPEEVIRSQRVLVGVRIRVNGRNRIGKRFTSDSTYSSSGVGPDLLTWDGGFR